MTTSMERVEKNGTAARGEREYLAFLRGQHLTLKQRVLANCYECTGMYTDGKEDCGQRACVFHVHMPYRNNDAVKERTLSGETKAKTVTTPVNTPAHAFEAGLSLSWKACRTHSK
jgi:hypothetical protein